jgi:hypothetical protein
LRIQIIVAAAILTAFSLFFARAAVAQIAWGGPDKLEDTASLADRIGPGTPVHIIYVHGMRADSRWNAQELIAGIETRLGFTESERKTTPLQMGLRPAGATYMGTPIWPDDRSWAASGPFVVRHRLDRARDGATVIVDEVNWWPLIGALKCRFLLLPERDLSGVDKAHVDLCKRWLQPDEAARLSDPPKGGHAAAVNRMLKQQIMNWGLADAVIALGPMQTYLHRAMEEAFAHARRNALAGESVVLMAESLGSFVVMDAIAAGSPAAEEMVIDRTDDIYFFANQFALLELGRVEIPSGPVRTPGAAREDCAGRPETALEVLCRWGRQPTARAATAALPAERRRQIVAFSDPSDLLTYVVPPINNVAVVNLYDRNETRWLGLIANPLKAHAGHLTNKAVWSVLLRKSRK